MCLPALSDTRIYFRESELLLFLYSSLELCLYRSLRGMYNYPNSVLQEFFDEISFEPWMNKQTKRIDDGIGQPCGYRSESLSLLGTLCRIIVN
jgi:hypothetical protein